MSMTAKSNDAQIPYYLALACEFYLFDCKYVVAGSSLGLIHEISAEGWEKYLVHILMQT